MIWSSIAAMTSSWVLDRATGRQGTSFPAGFADRSPAAAGLVLSTIALF
nr:hypothetical protein [Brachybacterium faecium]